MSCVEKPSLVCGEPLSHEHNCGGVKKMKVSDAEGLENPLAMCDENRAETKTKPSTFPSADQPQANGGHIKLMGTRIYIESTNIKSVGSIFEQGADDAATSTTLMIKEGGSDEAAVYSQRYKDVMDALLKPDSSYNLLYEPEPCVVQTPKTPSKKKEMRKSTQISVHKSRMEKTPTKKEAEYRSFPQNVRTLTATGILDGVAVRYLSASREKELRGMIKGASYLCGCTSCNFTKEVTSLEFESHADFKTSHPNNHIHLENGKSLHQVVQELKSTPPSMLCDAIQTLIGASLNREAFFSWKESFEAASRKRKMLDDQESNTQDMSPIQMTEDGGYNDVKSARIAVEIEELAKELRQPIPGMTEPQEVDMDKYYLEVRGGLDHKGRLFGGCSLVQSLMSYDSSATSASTSQVDRDAIDTRLEEMEQRLQEEREERRRLHEQLQVQQKLIEQLISQSSQSSENVPPTPLPS